MICYYIKLNALEDNVNELSINGFSLVYRPIACFEASRNIAFDNKWHENRYGFPLSNWEQDVFITHQIIWKDFLLTDHEWCLIVEDGLSEIKFDIIDIQETIALLPTDWGVFFPFDGFTTGFKKEEKNFILNDNIRESIEIEPFLNGFQWGSDIYLISRLGALRLLHNAVLRQRVDDEILFLGKKELLCVYFATTEWFSTDNLCKTENIERQQNIRTAILGLNYWLGKSREIARSLLKIISETANSLQIELLLQGGTHLGYVRHNGLIPWDDDIDLGIDELQVSLFLNQLSENPQIKFAKSIEKHTQIEYYKIWTLDGEQINGFSYNFPFVDLWLFEKKGKDILFKNGIICPNANSLPFIDVKFEGSKFQIPSNSIECLNARYKDWQTQIRVYNYNHRTEKPSNKILHCAISVDENGKMI